VKGENRANTLSDGGPVLGADGFFCLVEESIDLALLALAGHGVVILSLAATGCQRSTCNRGWRFR
jgi:hypothetical protein